MKRFFVLLSMAILVVTFCQTALAMPAKPMSDGSVDIELGYAGSIGFITNAFAISDFSTRPGGDISIAIGSKDGFGFVGYCGAMQAQFTPNLSGASAVNFHFSDFALNGVWTDNEIIGGGLSWGVGILARAMPLSWKSYNSATTTNVVGVQVLAGYNGRKPEELFGLYAGVDGGYGYSFTQGTEAYNTAAFTYDAEAGITIGITRQFELNGGMMIQGMGFPANDTANFAVYGYRVGLGYKM